MLLCLLTFGTCWFFIQEMSFLCWINAFFRMFRSTSMLDASDLERCPWSQAFFFYIYIYTYIYIDISRSHLFGPGIKNKVLPKWGQLPNRGESRYVVSFHLFQNMLYFTLLVSKESMCYWNTLFVVYIYIYIYMCFPWF